MKYLGSRDDFMGNYPPGAAHDPRAPYNEVDLPEVKVYRKVMVDLEKECEITTDDYIPDGNEYEMLPDFSDTDLVSEYRKCHASIPSLLSLLKDYLLKDRSQYSDRSYRYRQLSDKISDCEGWLETNIDIDEV